MELNSRDADVVSIFGKGLQAHNAGDLSAAEQLYQETLSIQPNHSEANHNIGVVLATKNELNKALRFFKYALDSSPNVSLFWASYIDALIKLGRIAESKTLTKAVTDAGLSCEKMEAISRRLEIEHQEPGETDTQKLDELIEQKRFDDVQEKCLSLLETYPSSAVLNINLGKCYFELGHIDQAITCYKKATEYQPQWVTSYILLGQLFSSKGKADEAIETYKKALLFQPDYAQTHNHMGVAFAEQGKLEEAVEAFNNALSLNVNDADIYNNLGNALKEQGKSKEAVKAYNKALVIKPDYASASHMVSSLTGKTTKSAPKDYVEGLFNRYAQSFDEALVQELEYGIPKVLTQIIVGKNREDSLGAVMDLGCGTGLVGSEIKTFCGSLAGIDLSNSMLEQAKLKKIYDKLIHMDIIEYLYNVELNFDYFIAADVFTYIGDLNDVFHLIKSRNKRSGKLVFSTEHTEKHGFHLEQSGRYSHSKDYIEALCEKFNYSISHFSKVNLRKEKGRFLTGGLYLLNF